MLATHKRRQRCPQETFTEDEQARIISLRGFDCLDKELSTNLALSMAQAWHENEVHKLENILIALMHTKPSTYTMLHDALSCDIAFIPLQLIQMPMAKRIDFAQRLSLVFIDAWEKFLTLFQAVEKLRLFEKGATTSALDDIFTVVTPRLPHLHIPELQTHSHNI
tara:strand:+ start:842 stop:1336 length:495 start_codon:yes stop_codon:yes gene_type:complete